MLVAAVGRAEMIRGDWIKPGAVVIDVGINRVDAGVDASGKPKTRLVGDVAFDEARERAGAITPGARRRRADDDRAACFRTRSRPLWRESEALSRSACRHRGTSAQELVDHAVERVEVGVGNRDLAAGSRRRAPRPWCRAPRQAQLEVPHRGALRRRSRCRSRRCLVVLLLLAQRRARAPRSRAR